MTMQASKRALVPYREAGRTAPYERALRAAGAEPVLVETSGRLSLEGFDGLVLTGGGDIDPALYGEQPHEHTEEPDRERDRIEIELLREALRLDLPVLAICRGMQLLNVFHGGTLHQHLEGHRKKSEDRADPVHGVSIDKESLMARIARTESWEVNSRHHQAVGRLGEGLRATAHAPDGIVEAIERSDKQFVLAVQWHPEDQVFRFPEQLALFTAFGDACSRCAADRRAKVETYR